MRVHVTHNLHPAPHIDQAFGHVGDGQKIIAEAGYVSRTTQRRSKLLYLPLHVAYYMKRDREKEALQG